MGGVGLWVGPKLTADESYFEMEITDCGVEGNIYIGITSWNHPLVHHIGQSPASVGICTSSGM